MKYSSLPRSEQYRVVFNAGQKQKILNRRLVTLLKELRELVEITDQFEQFNGTGHTKLQPLQTKADIKQYYERLIAALKVLDDSQVNLWIANNDKAAR